jgi:mannan endo-1,4-beta-mannosidase
MRRLLRRLATVVIVAAAVVAVTVFGLHEQEAAGSAPNLPPTAAGYLGVFTPGMPHSTAGLTRFESSTKTKLNVAVYYSGWLEAFQTHFAAKASALGAVTLVQIDPAGASLAAIAAGRYDSYLESYAQAVAKFGHPVIVSFGHEMNGDWYSWGYQNSPAADFVASWRHLVDEFRAWGAFNVTWLWSINSLAGGPGSTAPPKGWWPGAGYVNWVGIDGYYYHQGDSFDTVFGHTIAAVRAFTSAPVLISETGIAPSADKPGTIQRLFAGARSARVLGIVYFDSVGHQDWRLNAPDSYAAYRRAASGFRVPGR